MWKRWGFSLSLIAIYVSVFAYWMIFPSRLGFVVSGGSAVVVLAILLIRAQRRGYFVNRADFSVHGLVIIDLAIESILFEVVRLISPALVVEQFHARPIFIGCAIAFTAILGAHRAWALHKVDGTLRVPSAAAAIDDAT